MSVEDEPDEEAVTPSTQPIDGQPPKTTSEEERVVRLPDGLDSATTKLIFLYIELASTPTVGQIQRDLNLQLITLYPVLTRLETQGFIAPHEDGYEVASLEE